MSVNKKPVDETEQKSQFELMGTLFAHWAKWRIDPLKWLEFLLKLRKEDVVGLINGKRAIGNATLTTRMLAPAPVLSTGGYKAGVVLDVARDGIYTIEKTPAGLFVNKRRVTLAWIPKQMKPVHIHNEDISWTEFTSYLRGDTHKRYEFEQDLLLGDWFLEFLWANKKFIPEEWGYRNAGREPLKIMFTGTVFHNSNPTQLIQGLTKYVDEWQRVDMWEDHPQFNPFTPIAVLEPVTLVQ